MVAMEREEIVKLPVGTMVTVCTISLWRPWGVTNEIKCFMDDPNKLLIEYGSLQRHMYTGDVTATIMSRFFTKMWMPFNQQQFAEISTSSLLIDDGETWCVSEVLAPGARVWR